jgi:SAM-dependent methyltransferase
MQMSDKVFQEYYDKLYATKDYPAEVDVILRIAGDKLGKAPGSILDVGCGTGGHSLLFAEKGYNVVGADIDNYSIDVARRKATNLKDKKLTLLCEDVNKIDMWGFDLGVSLFNVVNYIHKVDELLSFFKAIYKRLAAPGLYIFDCWNGLAAILDLPREKKTQIVVNEELIEIRSSPNVDLIGQSVHVDNAVSVTKANGESVSFSFQYQHTLWTPFILKNLLIMAGFELLMISEWMKPDAVATHQSWKIMFICRKG